MVFYGCLGRGMHWDSARWQIRPKFLASVSWTGMIDFSYMFFFLWSLVIFIVNPDSIQIEVKALWTPKNKEQECHIFYPYSIHIISTSHNRYYWYLEPLKDICCSFVAFLAKCRWHRFCIMVWIKFHQVSTCFFASSFWVTPKTQMESTSSFNNTHVTLTHTYHITYILWYSTVTPGNIMRQHITHVASTTTLKRD